MKANDSYEMLTAAVVNPPARNHPVLEKRNSSRSRRSEQSSLLSVVDEDCLAGDDGMHRSRLPKSASDIKPMFGSTTVNVDRSRSSLDCGIRMSSSSAALGLALTIMILFVVATFVSRRLRELLR